MPADVYVLGYLAPIIAFFLVVFIVAAVLLKTQILGESKVVSALVALFIGSIFVAAAGTRDYVLTVVPWFGVLVISVFFLVFLLGFIGGEHVGLKTTLGVVFVLVAVIIFLVSGFVVFSDTLYNYLPGPGFGGGEVKATSALSWLYSARVVGGAILFVFSALATWILVKWG